MFRNILVPVDLSEGNRAAVEQAGRLADPAGASIVLIHVIERIDEDADGELTDFYEGLRRKADEALERWAKELHGVARVQSEVRIGRRAPEIVRCAEREGCDLIVLTSRGVDPQDPARGLWSVSHQVAIAAGCPVLLLR